MADDIKLQLGIDVEALQRTASQATNVLAQTFSQGLSANLLGNGLLPNQVSQPQSKDTLGGVIAAVQQVNKTLITGFNALAGGVYLGGGGYGVGGGGGGGGGPGAGAGAAGLAPPTPGSGVAGGGFGIASQILQRAGNLAAALMPSAMKMFMGGFYGTDVMGFAHNLVSQIPIAGSLLGAVTGPFHQVMQQNDEFKNMQYELFRDAGENAMHSFTNLWSDDDYREQFVKRYGLSRSETQQLLHSGFRRGLGQGGRGMEAVLNLQGTLGLGQEAAETAGSLLRAGGKAGDTTEVLATAIGVAVATGLERGRWGEMLSMWQKAAQSSVDTDIAWKEVASQQQFVGSLGARFQGDTAAAQSMNAALRAMASNAQSPLAVRAAMQLTGGDYFGATARMARAGEQPDTELEEKIIDQLMSTSGVQAWLAMPDGPEADRVADRLAGVATTFGTGLSQLKIATLLKARKSTVGRLFKPVMGAATAVGMQQVTGTAPLPETALGPRRSQSEAQRPSDISRIQETDALVPGGPQGQLQRNQAERIRRIQAGDRSAGMSMDELKSGQFTFSAPGAAPDATPPPPTNGYQQFATQGFGNPIPGRAPHPGVDLAFPPGTAVTCPVDGVVEHVNRNGTGMEVGAAIHVRAVDGVLWKLYHIDPATFPASLRVGQRIAKGTPLGRTYAVQFWKGPNGQAVRTHLHVGQIGPGGVGLDPMRPGGIAPGSLTGGAPPPAPGGAATSAAGGNVHVTTDVNVYVHQDPSGRPVVRARAATPAVVSSPGQLVGGSR